MLIVMFHPVREQYFQFFKFIHNQPHSSKGNYQNLILRHKYAGRATERQGEVGEVDLALYEAACGERDIYPKVVFRQVDGGKSGGEEQTT
jgi:hypothetical protein